MGKSLQSIGENWPDLPVSEAKTVKPKITEERPVVSNGVNAPAENNSKIEDGNVEEGLEIETEKKKDKIKKIKSKEEELLQKEEQTSKKIKGNINEETWKTPRTNREAAEDLINAAMADPEIMDKVGSEINKKGIEERERRTQESLALQKAANVKDLCDVLQKNDSRFQVSDLDGDQIEWFKGRDLAKYLEEEVAQLEEARKSGTFDVTKVIRFIMKFPNADLRGAMSRVFKEKGFLGQEVSNRPDKKEKRTDRTEIVKVSGGYKVGDFLNVEIGNKTQVQGKIIKISKRPGTKSWFDVEIEGEKPRILSSGFVAEEYKKAEETITKNSETKSEPKPKKGEKEKIESNNENGFQVPEKGARKQETLLEAFGDILAEVEKVETISRQHKPGFPAFETSGKMLAKYIRERLQYFGSEEFKKRPQEYQARFISRFIDDIAVDKQLQSDMRSVFESRGIDKSGSGEKKPEQQKEADTKNTLDFKGLNAETAFKDVTKPYILFDKLRELSGMLKKKVDIDKLEKFITHLREKFEHFRSPAFQELDGEKRSKLFNDFVMGEHPALREVLKRILSRFPYKKEGVLSVEKKELVISSPANDVGEGEADAIFSTWLKNRKIQSPEQDSGEKVMEEPVSPDGGFSIEEANKKPGFLEFSALYPDYLETANDPDAVETRFKAFEAKGKITEAVKILWKDEIEKTIGVKLSPVELVKVEAEIQRKAVNDPEFFLKISGEISEYAEKVGKIIPGIEAVISVYDKNGILEKVKELKRGRQSAQDRRGEVEKKRKYLWDLSETAEMAKGAFGLRYVRVLWMALSEKITWFEGENRQILQARKEIKRLNTKVSLDDLTSEIANIETNIRSIEEEIRSKEEGLLRLEDIERTLGESKERFRGMKQRILQELVPVTEVKEFAKQKAIGTLRSFIEKPETNIDELEKAQTYLENLNTLSVEDHLGIEFIKDPTKLQEAIDKRIEAQIQSDIKKAVMSLKTGSQFSEKLEKPLGKIMKKDRLGSKDTLEVKQFVLKTLGGIAKGLGETDSDRMRKLVISKLIYKYSK